MVRVILFFFGVLLAVGVILLSACAGAGERKGGDIVYADTCWEDCTDQGNTEDWCAEECGD